MNNETHISTFARLLATENITVMHDGKAETASFNVSERILTLPRWKAVDSHLYDMLIGHEVAHALWTPNEVDEESGYLKACVDIDPEHPEQVMGFLNIVEDARIERMIKEQYPGLRRDFIKGYTYLHNELDVFELLADESKIDDMILADRLNVYYKLGMLGIVKVPFINDEREFINRMDVASTFEKVVEITRDLYIHTKNEIKDMPQMGSDILSQGKGSGSGDIEEGDGDGDPDGIGDDEAGIGMDAPKEYLKTDDVFSEIERREDGWGADNTVRTFSTPKLQNMIQEPESIEEEWNNHIAKTRGPNDVSTIGFEKICQECRDWMREEQSTVKNLVKQFEMRKAADEHKRTMISKSGRLDTVKMIDYKWSEDIFARNTTVREGKNHGIVIFVDWSGSMSHVLMDVVKQAITLSMFAQQAGIPFEVYAFTDRAGFDYEEWAEMRDSEHPGCKNSWYWNQPEDDDHTQNNKAKMYSLRLMKFLSSDMNRRDFQRAAELFFCCGHSNSDGSWLWDDRQLTCPGPQQLHGTPLDECIVAAHEVVMNFRRKNNLQIVNCAILSDGCGASCALRTGAIKNPYTGQIYGDRPEDRILRGNWGDQRMESTQLLLKSLKDTTGCNLIGMFLHGGSNPQVWGWFEYDVEPDGGKVARKMYKNENFCIANGVQAVGYDEAYVMRANTRIEQEIELPNAQDVTHTKLRNTFVNNLKKKGMSRTLIRRFVEMIAR
jgi:hypothetical protein